MFSNFIQPNISYANTVSKSINSQTNNNVNPNNNFSSNNSLSQMLQSLKAEIISAMKQNLNEMEKKIENNSNKIKFLIECSDRFPSELY